MRREIAIFLVAIGAPFTGAAPPPPPVPGVVIDYSPAASGAYIGSPSIAILPDGHYVASHDLFGPGTKGDTTVVFGSPDRGKTWAKLSVVHGQFWSTLFVHRGSLYLIGTHPGPVAIRRSGDGGRTWTEPKDAHSGLLTPSGHYHCAPVPVIVHAGRIWRAMEESSRKGFDGLKPLMMSAPEDADLLKAASWTFSDRQQHQPEWLPGREFRGWLEGNAVVAPDGGIVNVLRLHTYLPEEKAAIIHYSADGTPGSFDPAKDIVEFPGGAKKFTIRRDPRDGLYWSLVNWVPEPFCTEHPACNRNTLALASSGNLRDWRVRSVILHHPDVQKCGFQYVDWQFDGDDLIAACRTAFDDGRGGAHNYHDANFLTFHRIANFRTRTMADAPPVAGPPLASAETRDLTITGHGWAMATLADGEKAFGNRPYVWKGVPEQFRGWRLTRTHGGERARIRVTTKCDTTLYLATTSAQKILDLRGWQAVVSATFAYTDKGETKMQIYSRAAKSGEEVRIPQGNWTGGLLLAPPDKDQPETATTKKD